MLRCNRYVSHTYHFCCVTTIRKDCKREVVRITYLHLAVNRAGADTSTWCDTGLDEMIVFFRSVLAMLTCS